MARESRERAWVGDAPTSCDACGGPIIDEFVDGKTRLGPWAIMCPDCTGPHGVGLGLGQGRCYQRRGGRWVKIAG